MQQNLDKHLGANCLTFFLMPVLGQTPGIYMLNWKNLMLTLLVGTLELHTSLDHWFSTCSQGAFINVREFLSVVTMDGAQALLPQLSGSGSGY